MGPLFLFAGGIYHGLRYGRSFDGAVFTPAALQQEIEHLYQYLSDGFSQAEFFPWAQQYGGAEDMYSRDADGEDCLFGFSFGTQVKVFRVGVGADGRHQQELLYTLFPGDAGAANGDIVVYFSETGLAACFADGGAYAAEYYIAAFEGCRQRLFIFEIDGDDLQSFAGMQVGMARQYPDFSVLPLLQQPGGEDATRQAGSADDDRSL